jgi:hypothetical protein
MSSTRTLPAVVLLGLVVACSSDNPPRCPGIYAFAYDDYPAAGGESGFHACTGGKQMEITFCPAG